MALKSFAEVQAFITKVLTDNSDIGKVQNAPHDAFWNQLTYDQFVNGNVPGVTDLNTGAPIPILVKGKSSSSNIILSLQGKGLFDPQTGEFPRMPEGGTPFTQEQINQIADWIDAGCPQ